MRTCSCILLLAIVAVPSVAHALDPYDVDPLIWLHESSPTARSLGMALTDVASIHDLPSPTGPGSVGLWALEHNVHRSQVADRRADVHQDLIRYEISNVMFAVGANSADLGIGAPFPMSFGLLRRRGQSHSVFYPGDSHGWTFDSEVSDWVVALGADLGVQVGLGLRLSYLREPQYEYERPAQTRDWYADYTVRLSLQHAMQSLKLDPRPLDFGSWTVDPIVSYGGDHLSRGEQTGFAYGFDLTMDSLPVLSAEHVSNPQRDNDSRGWEVCVLGTYAYRRGERLWPMTEYDTGFDQILPIPDWSTEGHAVYTCGLQRWLAHVFGVNESTITGWMLQNISLRYEWAAFRHPNDPPENVRWYFNQLGVREWSFELTGLRELWNRMSR